MVLLALFLVVLLTEVDRLTKEAQHGLRRTMEKYSATCRLILCCNSTSKVIPAIRSRCLGVRVGAPTEAEVRLAVKCVITITHCDTSWMNNMFGVCNTHIMQSWTCQLFHCYSYLCEISHTYYIYYTYINCNVAKPCVKVHFLQSQCMVLLASLSVPPNHLSRKLF